MRKILKDAERHAAEEAEMLARHRAADEERRLLEEEQRARQLHRARIEAIKATLLVRDGKA